MYISTKNINSLKLEKREIFFSKHLLNLFLKHGKELIQREELGFYLLLM